MQSFSWNRGECCLILDSGVRNSVHREASWWYTSSCRVACGRRTKTSEGHVRAPSWRTSKKNPLVQVSRPSALPRRASSLSSAHRSGGRRLQSHGSGAAEPRCGDEAEGGANHPREHRQGGAARGGCAVHAPVVGKDKQMGTRPLPPCAHLLMSALSSTPPRRRWRRSPRSWRTGARTSSRRCFSTSTSTSMPWARVPPVAAASCSSDGSYSLTRGPWPSPHLSPPPSSRPLQQSSTSEQRGGAHTLQEDRGAD